MRKYISKLHYKKHPNPLDIGVLFALLPASFFYNIGVTIRNFAYQIGIMKTYMPEIKTISVGNLTTGGVGKTPLVKAIADYLVEIGERPAILSRGYGAKLDKKDINIISDGKRIFHNVENAGDEPTWLAQNCKQTAVLTSSSRVSIAKYAQERLKCTALILDDGFQHIKLGRHLNILVIDYEKRFGNHLLLPAGPLRECSKGIKRADKIVVINKTQNVIEAKSYCEKLKKKHRKPTFLANMEFEKIYSLMSDSEIKRPKKVLAFCAIGQPEQFFAQLKENGIDIVTEKSFDDHYSYTLKDFNFLIEEATKTQCEQLITTEKDAVKLKALLKKNDCILEKEVLVVKSTLDIDIEELLK